MARRGRSSPRHRVFVLQRQFDATFRPYPSEPDYRPWASRSFAEEDRSSAADHYVEEDRSSAADRFAAAPRIVESHRVLTVTPASANDPNRPAFLALPAAPALPPFLSAAQRSARPVSASEDCYPASPSEEQK